MRSTRTHTAATLGMLLVCSSALPAAPAPRMLIDLTFKGRPIPQMLESIGVREAALIWAQYGVDVRTTSSDCVGRQGAIGINVVLADRPEGPLPDNALGSIAFEEDVPRQEILIYPDAIATLVSGASIMERSSRDWPTVLRNTVLGRALGRALAHELGHFLLRSREHSHLGLMRAHQSIVDLISPERYRFSLSSGEMTRLRATVPSAEH